jgi:Protein of unknown function (DUF3108)
MRLTPWSRWALCVLAVVALHALIGQRVAEHMADFGDAAAMPQRMEVAYVREMELTAPAAVAVLPSVRAPTLPRAKRATAASPAASQPRAQPQVEPQPPPEPIAAAEPVKSEIAEPVKAASAVEAVVAAPAVIEPEPEPSAAASAVAVAVAVNAEPAPAVNNFVWPGPTRLSYALTGNYRGEINGKAQVEWQRVGLRYQVHLDVLVGLPVAPLITRRMSSEGNITPEGLVPERFEEDTKMMFRDRRRLSLRFEPDTVVLANGQRQARPTGVQDSASQFVQLSYLFSINPQLLKVGGTVQVPLALARKIDTWTYDVVAAEALSTPFGEVASYHLKPRRVGQNTNDLTAEMWIAPSLQYLPARIRIRQDADTFIDMLIERKPQLAAAN